MDECMMDMSPARWLWLPGERTLPNTQVQFRRELEISGTPVRAAGWIFADSRYLLKVNGGRVQWGPAPADPRWPEVDPVDLAPFLKPGRNLITVDVLWFGIGEGTYVPSNPGFIFKMEIEDENGSRELVSDTDWEIAVDRSLPPGGHAQFMLRALQERRDLRVIPSDWTVPAVLNIPADKPTLCGPACPGGPQCLDHSDKFLRRRMIPLMREELVDEFEPVERGRVLWKHPVDDWFDFRIAGSLDCTPEKFPDDLIPVVADEEGVYVTFRLPEIMAGWPEVEIDAPAGTVVELIVQESHDPANGPWLDTLHYCWSRFTCAEGVNRLSPFDYYSMRFLQLHIHGHSCPVSIRSLRFRRRVYPFAKRPQIDCAEPVLQRLFEANLNTLRNSIQECNTDAVGRERQQYSGDCGHQQHPVRLLFGESGHGSRYLRTFADGQSKDGYFMDCWPGIDRLIRVGQRQLGITPWGPILDHGAGFVFDCFNYWMETGETARVQELLPQLICFGRYLAARRDSSGLIPAEHGMLGTPSVWMDHDAYGNPATGADKSNDARVRTQRRKTGSFNLYVAAMFKCALAPLCDAFAEEDETVEFLTLAAGFEAAVRRRFWSAEHGLFVDNLPWAAEDGVLHCSDRTLAMSVLYGFLDDSQSPRAADLLENGSDAAVQVGWSYIVNAVWRHRALIRAGRMGGVLDLLRRQWGALRSIEEGNAIPEHWNFSADSKDLWSHCAVVPLIDLVEGLAGIAPGRPGFQEVFLRPRPADIAAVSCTVHIPQGPVRVFIGPADRHGRRTIRYEFPAPVDWRLCLPDYIEFDGAMQSGSIPGSREYRGQGRVLDISWSEKKVVQ
jgi:hypothetical protein